MGIWIRSQGKRELICLKHLDTLFTEDAHFENFQGKEGFYYVVGFPGDNTHTKLGAYKTAERALEVLDEIQQYIADGCRGIKEYDEDGGSSIPIPKRVYEMPQE
jgi:hypothetical protein